MKRRHTKSLAWSILFLGALLFPHGLRAQTGGVQELKAPPATGIAYALTPSAVFAGGNFTYAYTLTSSPSSQQRVWSLRIGIEVPVSGILAPQGWCGKQYDNVRAAVGLPNNVGFHTRSENYDMGPGSTATGFRFVSAGPPGIATAYGRGFVPPQPIDESRPYRVTPTPPWPIDSVRVQTLAPTPPPSLQPFDPVAYLARIASLKEQAVSLGWIDSSGITNGLDQKLANASKQLQAGHIHSAGNILNAFLSEVAAQRGKHLNDAAYFLLTANVQFLQSKL